MAAGFREEHFPRAELERLSSSGCSGGRCGGPGRNGERRDCPEFVGKLELFLEKFAETDPLTQILSESKRAHFEAQMRQATASGDEKTLELLEQQLERDEDLASVGREVGYNAAREREMRGEVGMEDLLLHLGVLNAMAKFEFWEFRLRSYFYPSALF
jgi:hypothetical protein